MNKLTVSTFVAFFLAAGAVPAAAQEMTVEVRISDLDLGTDKGMQRLQRRLQRAASEICGHVPIAPLRERETARTCQSQALEGAREQVQLAVAERRGTVRVAQRTR